MRKCCKTALVLQLSAKQPERYELFPSSFSIFSPSFLFLFYFLLFLHLSLHLYRSFFHFSSLLFSPLLSSLLPFPSFPSPSTHPSSCFPSCLPTSLSTCLSILLSTCLHLLFHLFPHSCDLTYLLLQDSLSPSILDSEPTIFGHKLGRDNQESSDLPRFASFPCME